MSMGGSLKKEPLVSTLISFLNHPNSLEDIITWCYHKPFYMSGPFSCTLREQIRERERQNIVLFEGDVTTLSLLHAHV